MKAKKKIRQICCFLFGLLIVSSLAIVRQGSLMGYDFKTEQKKEKVAENDTLQTLPDGSIVVNTSFLAADIVGYAGKVPLEITIKDDIVKDVRALPNDESEGFFDEAATLLPLWKGKTVEEAAALKVDAVSGATYSSNAIIGNVRRGLAYAKSAQEKASDFEFDCSVKNIIGILVVLMAAILPLFVRNRTYHNCLLVLNVVVLGFWCGAFLSYTSLIGYMSNGMNVLVAAVPFVMLVTAFLYPLFGRKSYYCANVCPFGSLQQVVGSCVKYKIKMSPILLHRLDVFRKFLWVVLMVLIWGGVWSDWVDYEPFAAFIFQSASWGVIAIAALFVVLSAVVTRPYCRFVCPMGTLFKITQGSR